MIKRNKLEIIRDILTIIKENHKIKYTPLLRKSNISSSRFKEYYEELLKKSFIGEAIDRKGKKSIFLKEKGIKFVEKYKIIVNFIEEFEL